jgi:N-acetylglucosaminyl-diphospho-decaprenol L-rhamnosyltransferase
LSELPLFATAPETSPSVAPRVSVVIVHFRTPDVLEVCLRRIDENLGGVPHEVLVVDNAPLDEAAERLCEGRPGVAYSRNERNIGFGRAVNQGLAMARGEYCLVLNPDVEILSGSVEEMIAQMVRDPAAGLVAPKLLNEDGTLQHSCRTFYTLPVFLLRRTFLGRLFPHSRILREHLMLDYDHDTTRSVDWCLGASLLVRRRAIDDVGPMDERFFLYFEDVDWCYRMRARGWKVLYHPAAVMTHRYRRESARRPGKGLLIHLASTFRYYEKWSFVLYWLKRRSSSIRRAVLILSDLAAVNLAFLIAYGARSASGNLLTKPMFGFGRYLRFLLFTNAVALASLALAGMYRSRRREEAGEQLLGATRAIAATALIMMASTFLFSQPVYSRVVVGIFLPMALVLILLFRWVIFRAQGSIRSHRLHLRRIGILAPPAEVEEAKRCLERNPSIGIEILPLTTSAALLGHPRGGSPTALEEATLLWVQDERIAEVVLFEDWSDSDPEPLIERLGRAGVPVRLVPRMRSAIGRGSRMGDFLGLPALQLSSTNLAGRSWEKRLLDIILSSIAILLFLIPFLITAGVLRVAGRPSVERDVVGRSGKKITIRSLGGRWRGGAFTGILEFPTLLLWLAGGWSLVGIHPFDHAQWPELPEAYRRFPPDAPPGWITLAGDTGRSTGELCAANQEYTGRWSLALDLNLILERLRRGKGNR